MKTYPHFLLRLMLRETAGDAHGVTQYGLTLNK